MLDPSPALFISAQAGGMAADMAVLSGKHNALRARILTRKYKGAILGYNVQFVHKDRSTSLLTNDQFEALVPQRRFG